jgi:hypothetical protein
VSFLCEAEDVEPATGDLEVAEGDERERRGGIIGSNEGWAGSHVYVAQAQLPSAVASPHIKLTLCCHCCGRDGPTRDLANFFFRREGDEGGLGAGISFFAVAKLAYSILTPGEEAAISDEGQLMALS